MDYLIHVASIISSFRNSNSLY